ncbi:MAG: hypothetical protein U1D67_00235 [Dehalococcoidia bacterium]|nr:hypothetical protein [Dehalococcoidia bacterium]MDZ4245528.1 hypothetical protein [Dehalococcoidia bacterium]
MDNLWSGKVKGAVGFTFCLLALLLVSSCTGPQGPVGPPGPSGPPGSVGKNSVSSSAAIIVSPVAMKITGKTEIFGSGFAPGEKVTLEIDAKGPVGIQHIIIARVAANEGGALSAEWEPGREAVSVFSPGVYAVIASGDKGSQASSPLIFQE